MQITRIDKGDGSKTTVTLERAKECLEERGYFPPGTIEELKYEKENFKLSTDWAIFHFEVKKGDDAESRN